MRNDRSHQVSVTVTYSPVYKYQPSIIRVLFGSRYYRRGLLIIIDVVGEARRRMDNNDELYNIIIILLTRGRPLCYD